MNATTSQAPFIIASMAAKLARLVYRMLRYGIKYVDKEQPSTRPNTQLQIKQLKVEAGSP